MRHTFLIGLFAGTVVLAGCNNQEQAQLTPVPPPAETGYGDLPTGYTDPQPIATDPQPLVIEQPQVITATDGGNWDYSTPTDASETYTIVKGDTLYAIAKRHYGDGNRWKDILNANPGIQPKRLMVGQEITLP